MTVESIDYPREHHLGGTTHTEWDVSPVAPGTVSARTLASHFRTFPMGKLPVASVATPHDRDYAAIARATKERVEWLGSRSCSKWQWLENVRSFSLYTESGASRASASKVLATGVVKGSVREIASLVVASSQQEYEVNMTALCKEFKYGTYNANTPHHNVDKNTKLSIRSATFTSQGLLRRDETWRFLDATTYDDQLDVLERLLTSLDQDDNAAVRTGRRAKASAVSSVICGYRVQPEEPSVSAVEGEHQYLSRVDFFAEILPEALKGSKPRDVAYGRMLRLARNVERLSVLVRRRRLGVQVLMDVRRVPSLADHRCINCQKLQLIAKLCRVCGNGVCKHCSDKYERETHVATSARHRVDMVRVCDPCLKRIERGDYSNVTTRSLESPVITPDSFSEDSPGSTSKDLKSLLQDTLERTPSPQRKDAVQSVIQCLVDQERSHNIRPRTKSSVSTTASSEEDCFSDLSSASGDYAYYSGQHGRPYVLNPHEETAYPIPDNEAARLQAIDDLGVLTHGEWEELDIVCALAAREIGALACVVSVITNNEHRVIAGNDPQFKALRFARERSFCSHTIMDNRPLIIPHPEADVRVGHIARSWELGVRFYCGFPLMAEDEKSAIGTLCCVAQKPHDLTALEYHALLRLAATASKIIRLNAQKRRRVVL